MTGLIQELTEDMAATRRRQCLTCKFLEGLPVDEAKEWRTAMVATKSNGQRTFSSAALSRALARRKVEIKIQNIDEHRQRHGAS